jgi:hypothetical protein
MSVSFTRPTLGPHHYVTSTSSGWAEMFDRKLADVALVGVIGDRPLVTLIEGFADRMTGQVVTWGDVVEYLREIGGLATDPEDFPAPAAVAFWAHVAVEQHRRGTAKKAAQQASMPR